MDWSALRRLVAPVLIVTLLMGLAAPSAMALPQNPTRIYGEWAVDTPSSSEMVVSQESDRLIVEWESFSIGSGESVHFDQAPHQIALNRVTGGSLSEIAGSLSAGGQVFLVNPAGVVFGENAYVEVGGLLATSLDLSDSDFLAGRYRFTGPGDLDSSVVNSGQIVAGVGPDSSEGYVVLLAPNVSSDGSITAYLGRVALGAAGGARVNLAGGGLILLELDPSDVHLEHSGAIVAEGGQVELGAALAVLGPEATEALRHSGVIRATSAVEQDGRILLSARTGGTSPSSTRPAARSPALPAGWSRCRGDGSSSPATWRSRPRIGSNSGRMSRAPAPGPSRRTATQPLSSPAPPASTCCTTRRSRRLGTGTPIRPTTRRGSPCRTGRCGL